MMNNKLAVKLVLNAPSCGSLHLILFQPVSKPMPQARRLRFLIRQKPPGKSESLSTWTVLRIRGKNTPPLRTCASRNDKGKMVRLTS